MRKIHRSPHLSTAFNRLFAADDAEYLATIFELAISQGGENEHDFLRTPEESFNPLPARVALILLDDAGVRSCDVLAAAMLFAVEDAHRTHRHCSGLSEQDCYHLGSDELLLRAATRVLLEDCRLASLLEESRYESRIIQAACWLDRARHIHLADPKVKAVAVRNFINTTPIVIERCTCPGEKLRTLLSHWHSRFALRLMSEVRHDDRA